MRLAACVLLLKHHALPPHEPTSAPARHRDQHPPYTMPPALTPRPSSLTLPAASGLRFRWLVMGPFLVAAVLMALLSIASTEMLSAVRAYVGGESLWSKGQRDATFCLARFAQTGNAEDYRQFQLALVVPLGAQRTRVELDKPDPDMAVVRRSMLDAGSHRDDLASMIILFRQFRHVSFMAEAIQVWSEADEQIGVLQALGEQIWQRRSATPGATLDAVELAAWQRKLLALNDELTVLEYRFSATLGQASRMATGLVLVGTVLLGLALAGTAVVLSLRTLRRQALAEAALRDSEDRLKRALEASELTLWDCDVASGELYLSENWSRWRGGPWVETWTTTDAMLQWVPHAERELLKANQVRALRDPAAEFRVEHRVQRLDGQWLWAISEGRVVERAADGWALRMVGTTRDITERKLAEAARQALEVQLRESQKMEAIGVLAGGIAHDFNNILGAILGNVALAREDLARPKAALASLEQVNRAATRARGLVQQILAFSRRQPQELRERALRPVVEEALALMRTTLPAGVALNAHLAQAPLHVLADATQIQQVLMNLCNNAWHAMARKPGHIGVGLEAVELDAAAASRAGGLAAGHYAHLWVSDDGCGMDARTRERIFEPFFTTKAVGQGTGLGLAVVHGIIAAHHGAITVDSTLDQGSSFHIHLPLLTTLTNELAPPSDWGSLDELQALGQGEHVLYIDDDEVMLLLVDQLLRRAGYQVSAFQNPLEALAIMRCDPLRFDLVVSDYNMPQCSGMDVAREVAAMRPDLGVVISTGDVTEDLRAEAKRLGVRALVQKERVLEDLGAAVQQALGMSTA